jgi:hypothetical protein
MKIETLKQLIEEASMDTLTVPHFKSKVFKLIDLYESDKTPSPIWEQPSEMDINQNGLYESDNKVPYSSICGCNPKNGGSGICNCVIGNKLVDKPKRFGEVRTTNFPIM